MKNADKYKVGDKVLILHTHNKDLGMVGEITEVRCSFCKILLPMWNPQNGKQVQLNHTYGQFKKLEDLSEQEKLKYSID